MNLEKQETSAQESQRLKREILRAYKGNALNYELAANQIDRIEEIAATAGRRATEHDRETLNRTLHENEQLRERLAAVEADKDSEVEELIYNTASLYLRVVGNQQPQIAHADAHADLTKAIRKVLKATTDNELLSALTGIISLNRYLQVEPNAAELRTALTTAQAQVQQVWEALPQLVELSKLPGALPLDASTLIEEWQQSLPALAAGQGESTSTPLRPMATAPRDGTPVLLKFKSGEPIPERCSYYHGVPFVGLNRNNESDWVFTGNVGVGGIPDDWLEGWQPLPDTSAPPVITNELQREVAEWANQVHGTDLKGPLLHLWEEVTEAFHESTTPEQSEECADIGLCHMHIAALCGVSLPDAPAQFRDALRLKLQICRTRTWAAPDKNGVVRHIEPDTIAAPTAPTPPTADEQARWDAACRERGRHEDYISTAAGMPEVRCISCGRTTDDPERASPDTSPTSPDSSCDAGGEPDFPRCLSCRYWHQTQVDEGACACLSAYPSSSDASMNADDGCELHERGESPQGETYHCCNCPWHGDKSQAEEKSSLEDEGRRFYRACPECGFEALPALPDSGAGGVSESPQGEVHYCCNCSWKGEESQTGEDSSFEDEGLRFYRTCPDCGYEALPESAPWVQGMLAVEDAGDTQEPTP